MLTQKQMKLLALEQIGFKMDDAIEVLTATNPGRLVPNGVQLAELINAVTKLTSALSDQVRAEPDV